MRGRNPICLLFLACQLLMVSGDWSLAGPEETVRIAARDDARPFIWKDAETGHYLGFFWDICTEAVQRAGFRFETESIDATQRSAFLSSGTEHIDLLCDPTTITLQRMRNFTQAGGGQASHLVFSPIIFVANGTHAVQRFGREGWGWGEIPENIQNDEDPCTALKERPLSGGEETEPPEDDDSKKAEKPWITFFPPKNDGAENSTFEFRGYVEGTTIGKKVELEAKLRSSGDKTGPVICTSPMKSHHDAAKAFCEGRMSRYYGDADIVRASISAYRAKPGVSCLNSYTIAPGGTYEPYAFVASSRNVSEFPELLAFSLYSMFSDGTMERLYKGHFPETQKSQHLNTLFGVNAIPKGSAEPGKSVEAPEADASTAPGNSKVVSQ
ncbi:transporter substrate-binding domain-containing protein [uncultured Roseibium sp.]|uniref:transporter substrate-binding domain-containing protein n=1 Tax=uncultured Roseibium sp. TaxID=1936171 RepID=UPI002636C279|nr:transporter substrate-binding domain-containing protein [uncultured Roseibium sp.]